MLTSKEYSDAINQSLKLFEFMTPPPTPSSSIEPGEYMRKESIETTHYSIADQYGNIISNTYTLNSAYGSGVTIEGTGILMNNEMDDFSASPGTPNQFGLLGGEANKIVPEKRPLSSMTPTIILKDGIPYFATGTPGGSRIISAVLQSILNIVDFNMNLKEATFAKRIHHQWQPDFLEIEFSVKETLKKNLESIGYSVRITPPLTCIQTIMLDSGTFSGYGDFRRPDAFASGEIND